MSPVHVGPFQRIVGVHWPSGAESISVEVVLDWWGVPQGLFGCEGGGGGEIPDYRKVYSPAFFCTSFKLWPARTAYAAGLTDGIVSINGESPIGSDFTVAGMPVPTEHTAGEWTAICLNQNFESSELSAITTLQRIYSASDGLSVDFALRSLNTTGSQWCESGNTWQDLDSRGATAENDTYSFEAFRETLDFSGLTVTRGSDGQVFTPESLVVGETGGDTVFITLVPTSG